MWRWDQGEPFGNDVPNNNPSGAGAFDFPLRFPGQYFDNETGGFYNGARDYSPEIGRYKQADPVGLAVRLEGGLNLYQYVNAGPLMDTDTTGLGPDYWWRPCNKDQVNQCREECEKEGKEYESCAVRWIAYKGWRNGKPSDEAGTPSNGGLSCSCKEPEGQPKVVCDKNCQKTWKAIRDAAGIIILWVFVLVCS